MSGVVVGISGVLSGIFVVSANAWMNSPAGFTWKDGQPTNIDPVAAMFNAAWLSQALHMTLAAFVSTSFAVAGVHAFRLLSRPDLTFHRHALRILAHGDAHAEVIGLDRIPLAERPPTLVCHLAFQLMVGCGSVLALLGL